MPAGDRTQEDDIVISNIVVSNIVVSNRGGGGDVDDGGSCNFAYKKLLRNLQSIPISSQEATTTLADDTTDSKEEKTESISQSTNNTWDLSTDAQLATLLHELTNHITSRTQHVARDIRQLQQEVNNVGVNVALVRTQFMKRSNEIFMEQVVGDDDDEEESTSSDEKDQITDESITQKNDIEDNDDADIARLELEEHAAINDGMKALALNLFFDAKRRSPGSDSESGVNNNNNQIVESMMGTEEDIGDDCYYYAAAEGDMFNQRPLPFVIGSREFVESIASRGSSAEQQD